MYEVCEDSLNYLPHKY